MPKLYLVNKDTGRRFEILSVDKANGTCMLKGEMAVFSEDWDKDKLKGLGYVLEQAPDEVETEDVEGT